MKDTFARRLVNARKIRRISQQELCAKLDGKVPLETIQKYESAQKMPSEDILILLMRALKFKMDYFFRPFSTKVDINKTYTSRNFSMDMETRESIKWLLSYEIEKHQEIESILELESSFKLNYEDKQVQTREDAIIMAQRLRKDMGVGSNPLPSIAELLEGIGVKLIEIDMDKNFISAYAKGEDNPYIVLNKNMNPENKRYYAFRTLGDFLLNFAQGVDKDDLCDIFTLEVLLPGDILIELLGTNRQEISLVELHSIQCQYGVNVDELIFKAALLNVISAQYYFNFDKKKEEDLQFKETVERSLFSNEPNTRYERLVYRALACEIITTSKAAALLECSVSEVRDNLELL